MPIEPWQVEFAQTVEQHRREGWGWRYGDMKSWTSEKIFSHLRQLVIDTDAERFHQQAEAAGRIKVLEEDWSRQIVAAGKDQDFWPDFPLIASQILWERLASDVICPELVGEGLYRVVSAEEDKRHLDEVDGMPAAVAAVLRLAQYLQGFAPAERAAKYDQIVGQGIYDYTEWLLDFIERDGPDWIALAVELADVMSFSDLADRFQTELAMVLAVAGLRDEALSRARAVLQSSPDDEWVKILTADVYEQLDDDAEAIRLLLEALPMAGNRYDWEAVIERLGDAFERTGRSDELDPILCAYPTPVLQSVQPAAPVHAPPRSPSDLDFNPPQRLTAAPKIGRNDPCPCGSGKKYKKCCLS